MLIHQEKYNITPVSGTVGQTIFTGRNMLRHIFVKATTGTTTFDAKLTDIYGNDVFIRDDYTGELNELLEFPAIGNWTLTITNASADEVFNVLLLFEE